MLHMGNCCLVIHLKHCDTVYSVHAYNKHTIYRDSSISIWFNNEGKHMCVRFLVEYLIGADQYLELTCPECSHPQSLFRLKWTNILFENTTHYILLYMSTCNEWWNCKWLKYSVGRSIHTLEDKEFFKLCWSNKD